MASNRLTERWNERALESALASKNVNVRDADGVTPLWHAVFFGRAAWVTKLIDAGATLDGHDAARIDRTTHLATVWQSVPKPGYASPTGPGTLLHVAAARAGSVDVAQILLARSVAIDERDAFGCTALHIAAFHGQTALVEVLVIAGADVNALDRAGCSPLDHGASRHGVLQFLLTRGADPNGGPRVAWPAPTSFQWSVVTNAAQSGQVDVLSALIKAGAVLGMHPEALPLAALQGRSDAVGLLLKHGARVDTTTRWHGDALGSLSAAAVAASQSCVELLWPRCEDQKHDAVAAAVAASGGDTTTPPNDRGPARKALVEWLLDHGADPSRALIAAASLPDAGYVGLLLGRGARTDVADAAGEGPLVHAARAGRHRVAALLLARGADLHARAADGRTAHAIADEAYRKRDVDDARLVMRAIEAAGGGPSPLIAEVSTPVGPTVGRIVTHAKFGDGEIVAIDGDKLTIVFEAGEKKTLLSKFVTAKI